VFGLDVCTCSSPQGGTKFDPSSKFQLRVGLDRSRVSKLRRWPFCVHVRLALHRINECASTHNTLLRSLESAERVWHRRARGRAPWPASNTFRQSQDFETVLNWLIESILVTCVGVGDIPAAMFSRALAVASLAGLAASASAAPTPWPYACSAGKNVTTMTSYKLSGQVRAETAGVQCGAGCIAAC
jgi:hypothetical protein